MPSAHTKALSFLHDKLGCGCQIVNLIFILFEHLRIHEFNVQDNGYTALSLRKLQKRSSINRTVYMLQPIWQLLENEEL